MENIINLVKNLQTGEIKLLRHFYRFQEDNDAKKINLLFDLAVKSKACKKPEDMDRVAMEQLYRNHAKAGYTFARLKLRLKSDILNILLLQGASVKSRSRHDQAILDCRRMLIQGEILMSRGIYNEGIVILEKASCLARKHELFAEQILIDELCRNYNLSKSDEQEFTAFMKRIEGNTALLEKAQFAKYFHYEMTASRLFKRGQPPVDEWKGKLEKIRKDYEQSGSVKIGFYYQLSALNYYREVNDFEQSLAFGLQLQKSMSTNDILKTPYYSARVNLELAKCYLLTGEYDQAVRHVGLSGQCLQKDSLNEMTSLEILLHCYLLKQDFREVSTILDAAFTKVRLQPDELIYSKWHFLKAGVEFRMGNAPGSLKSLKECNGLLKDKNGWLLAYNLFEVICRIESGNQEWFEYRAEALKKIMQRYNKDQCGEQKLRFEIIYKVLRTLHKNNYDYVQTLCDEKANLEKLATTSYAHAWYMNGYEPVAIDVWLKSKAADQLKKKKSRLVA